ncbi:DUF262 domain-containing protein [uncultured Massilia sp.]|uniref:DUF262 domain-containing protein n=1 Tax=uncultured Massilia sp. TaxID=169973 RepID=UPI00258FD850|nr:DUF262 domain-containing protein [uncultured Massilia sp.]
MPTDDKLLKLEEQITEKRKTVDFDTREFTIEFIVKKYLENIDTDENDIFVPDYQREFVWDDERQSKLIESLVLGLPIPIIFLAEVENGRIEIVDGSQRIRTIAAFVSNELKIVELETLTELNGLTFEDLPLSRKRKINNIPIRTIVLSDAATAEVRNELFERINRGSDLLRNMEKRKGIYKGKFTDFIYDECAKNPILIKRTKLANSVKNRQELEELVLRFFAVADLYPSLSKYSSGVGAALDEYMRNTNASFDDTKLAEKRSHFTRMLKFVDQAFPSGFARTKDSAVSRLFFETISVGVHLALNAKPDLKPHVVDTHNWLSDNKFKNLISTERKTHDQRKIIARIEYVRDYLLGNKK